MNKNETKTFEQLVALISTYSEDLPYSQKTVALRKINEISSFEVDLHWLDNYWKSESVEEFSTRLAIEIIPAGTLNELQILEVVKQLSELVDDDVEGFDYLESKYSIAIEYHYKKTTGSLIGILMSDENDTYEKVVSALKSDDVMYL